MTGQMRIALLSLVPIITLMACGTNANNGAGGDMQPAACVPHIVQCTDQSIQQLGLFDTPNLANLANSENTSPTGTTFTTKIDATGGGLSPSKSFVYAKFTANGLARVDVSDETAFVSTDWDIAFRRFVIRTNSGVSGPGCVTVARTASATTFDNLEFAPAGLMERSEEYFADPSNACEYVPDGSGLGSPGVAMQSFWTYPGCVAMTDNVFVLTVAGGKKVKLVVDSYYTPSVQDVCDNTGALPAGASGAGNVVVKWAFLP